MNSGVYTIRCTMAPKFYIGSSKHLQKRWSDHKSELRNNRHHCAHLQRAWNKYGEAAFRFCIEEYTQNLVLTEQKWIDTHWPSGNLYNSSSVAGKYLGSKAREQRKNVKYTHSLETRVKISAAQLGRSLSEETKKKMSTSHKGRIFSAEHKKNLSIARQNRTVAITPSEETRKKMSQSQRERYAIGGR
jgi:group I intron endonuclease